MRKIGILAFFTASAMAFGCGSDGGGETGPVKIALLAPQSGALEFVGNSFNDVAIVAVENINSQGGINGRDLELTVADTETDAAVAPVKLEELIASGVIAVVGPATSGEVEMSYPVAAASAVPIISPSSTAPSLSGTDVADDGYMFRNVPDDNIQGVAMAYFLKERRSTPITNVTVIFEDTPYGNGLKNAFKGAFEDSTHSVDEEIGFTQNTTPTDAAAAVAQINADTTMVVMIALEQDGVKLTAAWDNNGAPTVAGLQWFMTDGARSSGFLENAPPSVHGMCGTAPTFPTLGVAYTALKESFESAYPDTTVEDQVFAPNVWDAFHLLAAAMVQQAHDYPDEVLGGPHLRDAITTVSADGQVYTAADWRQIISTIRGGNDVDYDGAAGPNDFDALGQAVGPYEVWCIENDGSTFRQELFLDASDIQDLQ
jgi:branched-chain amino acid transport system substrate-binding protein